jgi:predicted nicotinamide N-methyase
VGFWIPPRSYQAEIMDREDNSHASLEAALRDIRWTNRWLGGAASIQRGLVPYLQAPDGGRALHILDVGTGEADLPRRLVLDCRKRRIPVEITAVDSDSLTADIAAEACRDYPEIRVVQADAFALPEFERAVDLVTASMFLHHFRENDVILLLREFLRVAGRAVVINDLLRHRLPWAFISVVATLTGRSAMYRNDAPLSVLRGFTVGEFQVLAANTDAAATHLERKWPFRLVARLEPESTP